MSDKQKTTMLYNLDRRIYERLEKSVPNPVVNAQTTELEAGYKLGVQAVLKLLRDGFVVDA